MLFIKYKNSTKQTFSRSLCAVVKATPHEDEAVEKFTKK